MTETMQENMNLSNKNRFEILDGETKETLLENRKAYNTNRATKQLILSLNDFLSECEMPCVDDMDLDKLPEVMGKFHFSAYKKRISEDGIEEKKTDKNRLSHYKNSSLKSGSPAINRHFNGKFGADIISNEKFINPFNPFTRQISESKMTKIARFFEFFLLISVYSRRLIIQKEDKKCNCMQFMINVEKVLIWSGIDVSLIVFIHVVFAMINIAFFQDLRYVLMVNIIFFNFEDAFCDAS